MSPLVAWSPDILLTLGALGLVIFDALAPRRASWMRGVALAVLLVFLGLSGALALWGRGLEGVYLSGAIRFDSMQTYARLLFGAAGVLVVLASWDYYGEERASEYYALFLFSMVGELVVVASQSLIMLFLGIELLALPTYALVSILKEESRAIEAGLKYFLLGMFASVIMLYGVALMYGSLGTVSYVRPLFASPRLLSPATVGLLTFAFFFLFVGLGFKIVAFPFHFWSPDVYAGGSTPVIAYVSTVPKVAIVLALFRILGPSFAANYPVQRALLILMCILSMTYGNIVALLQTEVRRMLAYSGIANTGYMLIAFAAGGLASYRALLFFLVVYTFANMGAFFAVLGASGHRPASLNDFRGLAKRAAFLAFTMSVFLFSLAGTPPLAGFFGKFALFKAAVDEGLIYLALIALVNTVIAVGYYLAIALQMYGNAAESPKEPSGTLPMGRPLRLAIVLAMIASLVTGVFGIAFIGSVF